MSRISLYLILFGIWAGGIFAFMMYHNAAPAPIIQYEITANQLAAQNELEQVIKSYERKEKKLKEEIQAQKRWYEELQAKLDSPEDSSVSSDGVRLRRKTTR